MQKRMFFIFLLLLNLFPQPIIPQCVGPQTTDELASYLWSNNTRMRYTRPSVALLASTSSSVPPYSSAAPDNIHINLKILTIKHMEQRNSEFTTTLWLAMKWNDHRLKYKSKNEGGCFSQRQRVGFSQDEIRNIWTPNVVVQNLVEEPVSFAESFWIYPNGDVEWSLSLLLTLSCSYNFKRFPRDTQHCEIVLGSWKEDASQLKLHLEKPDSITKEKDNAWGDTLEWNLVALHGSEVELESIRNTTKSYLFFKFTLSRKPEYFTDFVVLPVLLMVVLSWASFFIDRASAPARVTMSIICFLTITNFVATKLSSLPRLGVKDIWLLEFMEISMVFTFYSVMEYVTCNYLYRVERRIKEVKRKLRRQKRQQSVFHANLDTNSMTTTKANSLDVVTCPVNKKEMIEIGVCSLDRLLLWSNGDMAFRDEHIEIVSRWLYPICYAVVLVVLYYSD